MTNGERLREAANPGLALWLANRIDCTNCPIKRDKCEQSEKSCSQKLFEWLEAEEGEQK